MPEMSDIPARAKNIFLSYVACVLPATLLHLNERSNIWPPSNVPIWVGALLQLEIDIKTGQNKKILSTIGCSKILFLQGNVVAFALLMTPFATNPLIYVASDPNYRRCPQIDTPNHLKAQSVINQRTNRTVKRAFFSGLIETVFASHYEETPWLRLIGIF